MSSLNEPLLRKDSQDIAGKTGERPPNIVSKIARLSPMNPSRRNFLASLAAIGSGILFTAADSPAQKGSDSHR
jgi:hypothetical protein